MTNDVAVQENNVPSMVSAGFTNSAAFDLLQRAGKMLASADLVPDVYRGKVADCALIVEMAQRVGASPLMVAQSLDIIHGRPSWRSQFLIASVNTCGRFSALRYEWRGEPKSSEWACRAWAIERATGERLDGVWITWGMVQAEGWSKKSGSKWQTMPEQMFVYRAAAFWTRVYAPDIALGFPTSEEQRDIIDVTPATPIGESSSAVARINAKVRAAPAPVVDVPAEPAFEPVVQEVQTAAQA